MNHKTTEEERQIRKERVLYIYFKLKEKNTKVFIESFIKKQDITSESTARRIFTDAADWKKSEISLFLATYTPTKSDSEAIDDVLGLNASKVSSEVAEEPMNDSEGLKDWKIINHDGKKYKFVYTGICDSEQCNKCALNCGSENCICDNKIPINDVNGYFVEETDIINELSAKNQELQKEIEKLKSETSLKEEENNKIKGEWIFESEQSKDFEYT